MAVLAIAAAGAAAGSLIGVGWATGWIAGSLIGTLLFPQRGPTQQGPRLGDLTVTSSAYGASIAIGYGTLRMAGNLIWSSGIREHKNVHDAGLGKGLGGGSRSTVTYSYSASFAVAFAEGPAEDVLRIWADGKLIFDKRGTSDTTAKNGLQLRFYPGDEQQLPDSLIEAYVGEGNAPAHRGLCYLVFEDLPLADYGNRIPNITAEIAFAATHQTPVKTVRWTGNATGWQSGSLLPDLERGYAYLERTGGGVNGLGRIDLRTMVEDRQQSVEIEGSRPHLVGLTRSGYLVATVGSTNSQPIHLIDPSTFQPIASWGMAGPGLGMTSTRFEGLSRAVPLAVYDLYGLQEFILCQGTVSTDIGLLRLTPQRTLEFLYASGPGAGSRPLGIIGGETREGGATAWSLSGPNYGTGASSAPVYLSKLTVAANARWDEGLGQSFGVERMTIATWAPGDLIPGAAALTGVGDVLWDATDQSLILFASAAGQTHAIKADPESGALRWRTSVPFAFGSGTGAAYSRLADGVLGWMSGNRAVALHTATGELFYDVSPWTPGMDAGSVHWFDSRTGSFVARDPSGGITRFLLLRRGGQEADLAAVVTDLCARTGLDPLTDLDANELAGLSVPGYALARPMAARDAIEPLATAFFFDGVESDGVLAFRRRGRPPTATLAEADLVPLGPGPSQPASPDPGAPAQETRLQEVELPSRFTVTYMDRALDYQQNTQIAQRLLAPQATMDSRHQAGLEIAAALDAQFARQLAEKALYTAWMERSSWRAAASWRWLALEPADVLTLALADGTQVRGRITTLNLRGDLSIEMALTAEEPAQYDSAAVAEAGLGLPQQTVRGTSTTRLILLDVPLLRDSDDTGRSASRLYYAMAGWGDPGWPGAMLYKSADASLFDQVGQAVAEAAWGICATTLPDTDRPFATDETTRLRVVMATGAERLESVTQLQMLAGANAAAVVKPNGEIELIQYRDVTVNDDGSYTLSGLLRGRRGTDTMTNGHVPGELFVLLQPGLGDSIALALAEVGARRWWKGVGFGQLFEAADLVPFTATGRDLRPYAPWVIRAIKSGTPPDIVLSWVRRTRIGGELRDGTGTVPLNEDSEAYEVDILSGAGGTVLRTLSSTSPSAVYANADILADFGAMPTSLTVHVCQLSAQVGRGFVRTVTLEIA